MEKVYGFDITAGDEIEIHSFGNTAQPDEEQYKVDIHKALTAACKVDTGWAAVALETLKSLGYVEIPEEKAQKMEAEFLVYDIRDGAIYDTLHAEE